MKITVTKEWFRSRAHLEEGLEIGAGLHRRIGQPATEVEAAGQLGFGQIISLLRRKRRWTIERLAREAEATTSELADIEQKPDCSPEPSTVYSLAKVFGLKAKALLQKAGLVESAGCRLQKAGVRYATCSDFREPLTPDEELVLEAVVKALVEHPQKD